MSGAEHVLSELSALRSDIAVAADAILFAAETGLHLLATTGDDAETTSYAELFVAIVAACAFQDITGQRLTKIESLLKAADVRNADQAPSFLEGPALPDRGLNQQAADALFDGTPAEEGQLR